MQQIACTASITFLALKEISSMSFFLINDIASPIIEINIIAMKTIPPMNLYWCML